MYIANPALWNTHTPNLYAAVTQIEQTGKVIDTYETNFGIRSIKFDAAKGFILNGEHVYVKGVCNHHDLGALGTAINIRALERQLEILKEMGVNAIRTSHNPPAPELLDLADKMGILILDEAFDAWTGAKKKNDYSTHFKDWHEKDLRAFIRRDRNHPSVIAWSTGNEIREQRPEGHPVSEMLRKIVHEEDPTRLVTVGANGGDSSTNGFQKTVDVFGFNYKPQMYAKFHADNPNMPVWSTESASTVSSRGEYYFPVSDDKAKGFFDFQVSSYDLYAPRWATPPDTEFAGQDKTPAVAGEFVWTGFDYLGEPTPFDSDTDEFAEFYRSSPTGRGGHENKRRRKDHGAVAKLIFRHRRSLRFQEGPILYLSSPLAARAADGPHPAALELAGPRRSGNTRSRLHFRRRGRAFPQRQSRLAAKRSGSSNIVCVGTMSSTNPAN